MDILNFISWIKGGRVVNTVDPAKTLLPIGLKDNRRDDAYLAGAISVLDLLALAGGLEGTNYVFVAADGTDVENAAQLQTAYNELITRSPSATNRMTVIAAPGYYNFGTTTFTMNTQYIDLVSLDGNRSVIFNSTDAAGTILVDADNVFVRGVDVTIGLSKSFLLNDTSIQLRIENCAGGDNSFGHTASTLVVVATFVDCQAGNNSFGFGDVVTLLCTYTDCVAGSSSFGWAGDTVVLQCTFNNCVAANESFGFAGSTVNTSPSSRFTNCVAGANSFGYAGNDASLQGTFTNCTAGNGAFGFAGNDVVLGCTFTNCTAGNGAFGFAGNILNITSFNKFTDCTARDQSFGWSSNVTSLQGIFTNCRAGNFSFGWGASNAALVATFTDCTAGNFSFGWGGFAIASGTFTNCVAGDESFGYIQAVGLFNNCTAGGNSFGGIDAIGTFNNCTGGLQSFGGVALTGKLYYCRLTSGTFTIVSGAGVTRLCIDGSNVENNQG